jgi:hypothetical protein
MFFPLRENRDPLKDTYLISIAIFSCGEFSVNAALAKGGGPKRPRALFENPYRSVGTPKKSLSSLLFPFSS